MKIKKKKLEKHIKKGGEREEEEEEEKGRLDYSSRVKAKPMPRTEINSRLVITGNDRRNSGSKQQYQYQYKYEYQWQ